MYSAITFLFVCVHVSSGYNVLERPVENDSDTLNVTVKFFIQQIFDLDEKAQYLQSAMWIELVRRLASLRIASHTVVLFSSARQREHALCLVSIRFVRVPIEVDRLHAALGARGVRRNPKAACALLTGLAARHPHVQQVRRAALVLVLLVHGTRMLNTECGTRVFAMGSADDKFDGMWAVNAVIEHTGEMQNLPPAMMRSAPLMCPQVLYVLVLPGRADAFSLCGVQACAK